MRIEVQIPCGKAQRVIVTGTVVIETRFRAELAASKATILLGAVKNDVLSV